MARTKTSLDKIVNNPNPTEAGYIAYVKAILPEDATTDQLMLAAASTIIRAEFRESDEYAAIQAERPDDRLAKLAKGLTADDLKRLAAMLKD